MKLTRSLHGSDVLELNEEEIDLLRNGNSLHASGLLIKKAMPDVVIYYKHDVTQGTLQITYNPDWADLRVTYLGTTGKMLSAEVLK